NSGPVPLRSKISLYLHLDLTGVRRWYHDGGVAGPADRGGCGSCRVHRPRGVRIRLILAQVLREVHRLRPRRRHLLQVILPVRSTSSLTLTCASCLVPCGDLDSKRDSGHDCCDVAPI
ncbi:Grx_C4-glutaredoxin subgroup I, partial [Zea mays]